MPGATKVDGVESVMAPVDALTVIWLAVPDRPVTPVLVNVTLPVEPDTDTPVPATADVTPVFVTVIAPVDDDTEMPVPAVRLVGPVLAIVIDPAPFVTLIPDPAVNAARV